ncbi:MAG: hypothetical protein ACOC43_12010 [Desulfohalobiaceae bacterium]
MARRKPVFCEKLCPVCRGARSGKPFWSKIQKLELKLFGERGCPLGRARTSYYGVLPHQKLRQDNDL